MEQILENLNPAQREAVVNYQGPSLIVAGAGSGKTRVLTSRIAYMITQGVAPQNILALTFTNKAAAEMRERIEGMAGGRSRYIQMGTFHSIFLRILRREHQKAGYPAAFTIYDTTDSQNLVKSICKEMGLGDNDKYKPRAVFAKISRLKNDLVTPAVYAEDPVFVADDAKRGQTQFLEIYKRYAAQCRSNGAMDFDDLLVNMVLLMKNHPDVLEKYREIFRYILVDEYQDTNLVQYKIVRALAAHGNICVVGDDSQSIYSFRGARIENILSFKRDFPAAKVYKLEQNYRSTQVIVKAANGVIAKNRSNNELKKECFSEGARGERIKLLKAYTDREEAEMVAGEIRSLGRNGVQWSEIAVLYRVNALSRSIEESLRRRDIPYKIYRGHSFFDRKEIKDLLAYFRLIVNPRDDEAFRRIVNYPTRGIGEVTQGRLAAEARERGMSLWDVATTSDDKKIAAFAEMIEALAMMRGEVSLYELGREVAVRSGIVGVYRADNSAESISALENIDELLNSMVERRADGGVATAEEQGGVLDLDEWLQNVALMTDADQDEEENKDKVSLMTVHSAKGLEFKHVFVMGLEEDLFPSLREGDRYEVEEERRLFYVALTRARERAYLSLTTMRFLRGVMDFRRPSRFVEEIDAAFMDEDGRSAEGNRGGPSVWSARGGRSGWESRAGGRTEENRGQQAPVRGITPPPRFRKIEVEPMTQPSALKPPAAGALLVSGARVTHAKFGTGTILEAEPAAGATNANDLKIVVQFDDPMAGKKTLLSKFARLDVI